VSLEPRPVFSQNVGTKVHNAVVRLSFLILFALASAGCNQAKLTDAPDASPNCGVPLLESPCRPQAAGQTGCGNDLDSGGIFLRDIVLDGGSFPPSCTVIVYDPVPDEQNQCTQMGTCRCDGDAGAYNWVCLQ
jgi:hypothetical protein